MIVTGETTPNGSKNLAATLTTLIRYLKQHCTPITLCIPEVSFELIPRDVLAYD